MKNLLSQFVAYYEHNEEFQREMANFQYVIKSEDWMFHKKMLMIIKGVMAESFIMFHTGQILL